jgi:hypothetical protein
VDLSHPRRLEEGNPKWMVENKMEEVREMGAPSSY